MPAHVEITWHTPSGQEDRDQGNCIIHFTSLFVNGVKKRNVKELCSPPESPETGTVLLRFANQDWCEVKFRDLSAAPDFAAKCQRVFDDSNGKSKHQLKPIDVPGSGLGRSERAGPPVRTSRPLSEISASAYDFEMMSQQSRLPGSTSSMTSAASDAAAREAKRRHIDSVTSTTGTPEKVGRTLMQTPIRRAPAPRSSLLNVGPRRPDAPQRSSSYGGYRSSLTFGLRNLGNTCYLNAVMQACCSLRELFSDLRTMEKTLPACKEGALYRCTVETLQQMSSASSATGPVSPTKLRELIGLAAPMFQGNAQQDAHEFFLEFVNQLHDELLAARNHWLAQRREPVAEAPEDTAVLATQLHLDSEVQKRLTCVQCQHLREVTERFRDFSLDFSGPAGSDRCSLTSMLRAYFDSELLEAKCEHCNDIAAHMEKQLTSPPRVLVLHLKRFTPNLEKQRYDKQHQCVEIPPRLDLNATLGGAAAEGRSPQRLPARPLAAAAAAAAAGRGGEARAASPSRGPAAGEAEAAAPATGTSGLWYNLRAVVAHDGGSPHSGHYTCYARGEDGSWRLYDDSIVQEVQAGQELHRKLGRLAYIVFYVLQAPDAKA